MTTSETVPYPPDDDVFAVTIKVMRFPRGGYLIAETGEYGGPVQAVSNFNELVGALGGHLQVWNEDMTAKIAARYSPEDVTNVVQPKKWWRAVK